MSMMAEMMSMSMKDMKDAQKMDMAGMQACIEACSACEQACTVCADGMMDMPRCASMCASTADVCNTMMRMMMRPAGYDMATMMSMLETTIAMCKACAAECMMHADMREECRMCAQACMECQKACEAMLMSMKSMSMS